LLRCLAGNASAWNKETDMNHADLIAIDVHTHLEVSC